MAVTINTVDTNYFTLNGTRFAKIYIPLKGIISTEVGIYNSFDTCQQILNSTPFAEFTVDAFTYASADLLMEALLPVIYKYASVGGGGAGSVDWGNITGTLSNQIDLGVALSNKSDVGHSHSFASLTSKPTTIAGYGITNAYTKTEVDSSLSGKSDNGHTHLLAAGATDVTATAAELNLLDLAGLTAGWVLSADTASTASWKAPSAASVAWGAITGTLSSQIDLQNTLNTKLDSTSYTAADVLTKIKTVDGVGSGLDADLLQGLTVSVSGNRWDVIPAINSSGVIEVGKYIDFHNTDASAGDNDGRLTLNSANSWTFSGNLITSALRRSAHETGYLEGGYNNIAANNAKSNPIYCIGSAYNPAETTLSNMYGIGFCAGSSATFINATDLGTTPTAGHWGLYVAADGNARIFLNGTNGTTRQLGVSYASNFTLNSDRRRKSNIKDYNGANLSIRWRTFELDTEKGQYRVGVVAQELLETNPEFVNQEDSENYTVNSIDLLNAAMAAKDAQIEDLTARIDRLELILTKLL